MRVKQVQNGRWVVVWPKDSGSARREAARRPERCAT